MVWNAQRFYYIGIALFFVGAGLLMVGFASFAAKCFVVGFVILILLTLQKMIEAIRQLK